MAKTTADLAWEVALEHEPKLAAAFERVLTEFAAKLSLDRVRALIISGDLAGLSRYLDAALGKLAAPVVAVLDGAMKEAAARAAVEINAWAARTSRATGAVVSTAVPFATGSPAMLAIASVTPEYIFNPVNPRTIAAARAWQGNLIQQVSDNAKQAAMEAITDGLIRGQNPRAIARTVKQSIGLTRRQAQAVIHFRDDLEAMIASGVRSAETWGLYTPRQIAALKARDPALYRRLNFTAAEIKGGRRWGKISRAAGTLQFDPATGVKPSKPIGFVAPPGTQGGPTAYRLTADGKLVDHMTAWRLRDKRFDPLVYDAVAADERLGLARAAGTPADVAAAEASREAALQRLAAAKAEMVDRYRARYLKHRSEVIARTESMRAANLGAHEAWRQSIEDSDLFTAGQVRRRWVTAKDDRVRPAHRAAHGQTVGMDEPFRVGGDPVMHPPHQPNCRCSVSYDVRL